jgi:hypothetical protein
MLLFLIPTLFCASAGAGHGGFDKISGSPVGDVPPWLFDEQAGHCAPRFVWSSEFFSTLKVFVVLSDFSVLFVLVLVAS